MKLIIAKNKIYSRLSKLTELLHFAFNSFLTVIYGEVHNKIHLDPQFISHLPISPTIMQAHMHACLAYQHPTTKKAIFDLKYRKNKKLAEIFGKILYEKLLSLKIDDEIILVPIPPHKKRVYEYGFSQTFLLAEAIATHSEKISIQNILIYTHDISDHKMKKRSKRLADARNQFLIPNDKQHLIENKTVIIIDDIITTGSTCLDAMRACASVDAYAKAKSVIALAIAH